MIYYITVSIKRSVFFIYHGSIVTQCCITRFYTLGPAVVFMFQQLKHIGSKVTPDHLVCTPCGELQAGGFLPTSGAIVLCQGKFIHKKHMESTIVHELVHLYDQSKFKVDWDNLRHHACSEV